MKWVRLVLVPLILVAFASTVFAQGAAMDSTAKPMHTKSGKSHEDMAKEQTAKMKAALKVTDDQSAQFESIMMDSYKKMADAKKDAAGDKTKMKASMDQIMKDRSDALSKVLTPDQMKMYDKEVSKNMKAAKKQMKKASS